MMRLYNTISDKIEEIKPSNTVKIYLCGVTVYDDCHIGHARTIIVFDILKRFLITRGIHVILIQNFTDVDDKIINRALRENTSSEIISKKYTKRYFEDFDALNVLRAQNYPKVTDHIEEINVFIDNLIQKGKAYLGLNGVYFRVKSFPDYGKLSKNKKESIESGSRIEIDSTKEDPRDFVLWKFSSSSPKWNSPWGEGRPGWHIECSVMALKYLDSNFDIHGGGQDLIFPHHENEIAQSEALSGKKFANIWLHVGMITNQKEKMSKSLGNTIKIHELLKRVNPNVIRLFCISAHYTKPIDFSETLMDELLTKWRQIENAYYELKFRIENPQIMPQIQNNSNSQLLREEFSLYLQQFENYLLDDLNFPNATTIFFQLINKINFLISKEHVFSKESISFIFETFNKFMFILGLKIPDISREESIEITELVEKRNMFRKNKNYNESDKIRNVLLEKYSIELLDHRGFTVWKKFN